MRRFLINLGGLLLVAFCLGLFIWRQLASGDYTMPDGSIMRVEKVSYGQQEHFKLQSPLEKLEALLPVSWQAKLAGSKPSAGASSWDQVAVIRTNEDALYIYISRRTAGRAIRSVDARRAQVVDKDGCVFESTQNGGYDDGRIPPPAAGGMMGYSVGWFRFEAFPRREKKLRLLVYDSPENGVSIFRQINCAEFMIDNPDSQPQTADWPVERLPVARTQEGVSFILTKVTIQTNGFPPLPLDLKWRAIVADYEFEEDGHPSTNWQALETDLYDSSGNFISGAWGLPGCLCPRESAWKMRVKFFGSEKSRAASNDEWSLRGLAVPAPGQFTLLEQFSLLGQSLELQGVPVRAVTFSGAGDFTYSNNIALTAALSKTAITNDSVEVIAVPNNWTGKHSVAVPTFKVQAKGPHLAIDVGDLSDDQRFTVCAVDDRGREFYGHRVGRGKGWANELDKGNYLGNRYGGLGWYAGQGIFLSFDLPADAKTVDLTFCVHTCRTVEFVFKPPGVKPKPD